MTERPGTRTPEPLSLKNTTKLQLSEPPAEYEVGLRVHYEILPECNAQSGKCDHCPGQVTGERLQRYVERLITRTVLIRCYCICHSEI